MTQSLDNQTIAQLAIAIAAAISLRQSGEAIGPLARKVLETLDTLDSLEHFQAYREKHGAPCAARSAPPDAGVRLGGSSGCTQPEAALSVASEGLHPGGGYPGLFNRAICRQTSGAPPKHRRNGMSLSVDQWVATAAGLTAVAKFIYDWHRDRDAERPIISATLRPNRAGALLLRLKIIRLERHDLIVHKLRGHGLTFSAGGYKSGEWVPSEFFDELALDKVVTSEVSTNTSELVPFAGFESLVFFAAISDSSSKTIAIKLLISNASRRSRPRWTNIKIKISS